MDTTLASHNGKFLQCPFCEPQALHVEKSEAASGLIQRVCPACRRRFILERVVTEELVVIKESVQEVPVGT